MTEVRISWPAARLLISKIAIGNYISAIKAIRQPHTLDLKAAKMLGDALRDGQFTFETFNETLYVVINIDIRRITL